MRGRVTRRCIESLQAKLPDYINEYGDMQRSKNGKFRCFNSAAHNHGDSCHSAALVPGNDNKLWKCFACGASGDIFKAVDFMEGIHNFYDKLLFLSNRYNIPLEYDDLKDETETIYNYKDPEGNLIYRVNRKDRVVNGKKDKYFLPETCVNGRWVKGLKNTKRVLYNLPVMLEAARAGRTIYFVEGEKCADAVNRLGLCAVTIAGGVCGWGKFASDYIPYFKDTDTVIIPDNDEPGKSLGRRVYSDIESIAKRVRYLELPGLNVKEDVADWISKGGTADKLKCLTDSLLDNPFSHTENSKDSLIFVSNNCYCKRSKDNTTISLTNFVIEPIYKIQPDEDETPVIRAKLITENGSETLRNISTAAFDNVDLFRKTLNDTKFRFTGRIEALQYIKTMVDEKIPEVRKGVNYEGFHKVDGKWYVVSGDKTVDENVNISDKLLLLDGSGELPNNLLDSEFITKEELLELAPFLFGFNDLKIASTIIGFICGLFLKAKLMDTGIKYNHLLIEGQSGSGKSSTLENVITPLICMDMNSVLDASGSTNFALHRGIASSNFMPLIIDEYKPNRIGVNKVNSISNLLRNSYDLHKSIKGVPSLSKNREFISRASVILCGEAGIDETANIERSLKVVFSVKYLDEDTKECMNQLKLNRKLLQKLAKNILKGALKMNVEEIKNLHENISENLIDKSFKNQRIRNSVANCILGIHLLKSTFEDLSLNFEKACGIKLSDILDAINSAAGEDLLDNNIASRSVIEDSLETLNRMAVNGELDDGVDFDSSKKVDGELCLRLNYTVFYDRFIKYCKDYNVSHEVLSLNSFKKQLQKMDYCLYYNKPMSFKRWGYNSKEYRTCRAAVLSIEKLKEKNLDVGFLIGE